MSKIDRGERLERSGDNEIDYNYLEMQSMTLYAIELENTLNGQPWQRFAISEFS